MDLSAFGLHFGSEARIEQPAPPMVEQVAPIEAADGFDRVLDRMESVYNQTGDRRLALAYGLDQLCEEITPCIRSPRGTGDRPPSRKAKRRVVAAIRHFQASGQR